MAAPKFELYTDRAGQWRWRLRDSNGTKVASSGESFPTKSNAKRAAENVRATAPLATIDDGSSDAMNAALHQYLQRRRGAA